MTVTRRLSTYLLEQLSITESHLYTISPSFFKHKNEGLILYYTMKVITLT